MTPTDWVDRHRLWVRLFLSALAGFNAWISYTIFAAHPHLTLLNAAMAAVLVLGIVLTWRVGGEP